jgi:hypothetical protein
MKDMLDYELVKLIKETDNNDCRALLFKRYNRFISKHYALFAKNNSEIKLRDFDWDDFRSEAYFYFLEAIDYTDLNKIYDPKSWKFLGTFMYFLNILRNRIVLNKNTKKSILPHLVDVKEEVLENIDINKYQYSSETALFEKECIAYFERKLSPFEKKVYSMKKTVELDGRVMSTRNIAKVLKCNHMKIQVALKGIKTKFNRAKESYGF